MTENFRKNEKLCYEDFGRLILSLSPQNSFCWLISPVSQRLQAIFVSRDEREPSGWMQMFSVPPPAIPLSFGFTTLTLPWLLQPREAEIPKLIDSRS